jgi:hypothetical protein
VTIVRQYLVLFILLGIVILAFIGNLMMGDLSDVVIPSAKYRWFYWEVDRTTAILFQSGQIVGGMAVFAVLFRKELKAIIGVGLLYAIVGISVLSQYLTNNPNLDYLYWRDFAFLGFPALFVILKLTGRMRPFSERTQAEQQAILLKREKQKQELSKMLEDLNRYWWLKWLPLLLVVAALPTAWIGWLMLRDIRGLDEMYPIYAGFLMAMSGMFLFMIRRNLKWQKDLYE